MNKRVSDIIEAARKLTPEEREELLARLHIEFEEDVADGTPEEIEAAWVDEAHRRAAQVDKGQGVLIPWDDVLAELKK